MFWPWTKKSVVYANEHIWAWSHALGPEIEWGPVKGRDAFWIGSQNTVTAIGFLKDEFRHVQFNPMTWSTDDALTTFAFEIISFHPTQLYQSETDLLTQLETLRKRLIEDAYELHQSDPPTS